MMPPMTSAELIRDIGRMEGLFGAMEDRLSKLEASVEQIRDGVEYLKNRESERKGAWWALVVVAGVIGWLVSTILNHATK